MCEGGWSAGGELAALGEREQWAEWCFGLRVSRTGRLWWCRRERAAQKPTLPNPERQSAAAHQAPTIARQPVV